MKKILLIPAVLLGLYLACYLFSTLLLLFPGNKRITGKKLKLGSLILSLTLFAFPGGRVYVEGTCYDREMPVMEISTEGQFLLQHTNLRVKRTNIQWRFLKM